MAKNPQAPPDALPPDFSGTISVRPVLRRNPAGPLHFSPVVDVRYTDRDFRLLSFIIPPADPEEVVVTDGRYTLPVQAQCEWVLPPETVVQLIEALQVQLRNFQAQYSADEGEG